MISMGSSTPGATCWRNADRPVGARRVSASRLRESDRGFPRRAMRLDDLHEVPELIEVVAAIVVEILRAVGHFWVLRPLNLDLSAGAHQQSDRRIFLCVFFFCFFARSWQGRSVMSGSGWKGSPELDEAGDVNPSELGTFVGLNGAANASAAGLRLWQVRKGVQA